MKPFFNVKSLETVLGYAGDFPATPAEEVPIASALGRVLAETVHSDIDLPGFARSTMDGYAVRAASTFGASESGPAFLTLKGSIAMGETPEFSLGPGEAVRIATGGMLPEGADAVVMVEHTEALDAGAVEVYKSAAPGGHVIEKGEDFKKDQAVLSPGVKLRPQEIGLLAAMGCERIKVHRRPGVAVVSTGDEVVPVDCVPRPGQIRDVNTYTLSALAAAAGGAPRAHGIIKDDYDSLCNACRRALADADMVLISGGSSVGSRDYTTEAMSSLPDAEILTHGVSISPGKPTILARSGNKAVWGLPGHVVSAMVVFSVLVRPFLEQMSGLGPDSRKRLKIPAILSRSLASAQGRTDFVRVRLTEQDGLLSAEPVLGKSGLINTMIRADGLIEIDVNTEGLDKGAAVTVYPF